jgi:hypothetical protein
MLMGIGKKPLTLESVRDYFDRFNNENNMSGILLGIFAQKASATLEM